MKTLMDAVVDSLKVDERFVIDGKLAKNKIVELALNLDPALLKLLLSNEQLKSHFFTEVEGMLIFDKVAFQRFVNNKSFLPDSFTQFKNKIGLSAENHYLSDSNDVVLSWPYKDCILEGGQTKDDQKRSEIFWNETLAPEQIDTLLAPKALTNFKKYSSRGESNEFVLDDIDNWIIKGNNLLALHSLKARFMGEIDLIYIDPPYNTENDSFKYNDRFTHSTWLTFMKNRLEVAKELLSETGAIAINIDQNESHYLKVLCDHIFGRSNFINEIVWAYGTGGNYANSFSKKHDNIFLYAKNKDFFAFQKAEATIARDVCEACDSIIEKRNNLKKHIDEDGRVYRTIKSNGKIYKYYDDEPIPLSDVWFLGQMQQQDPERVGFNSQKPERLLERLIKSTTKENGLVLDFHIGTGTTASAAHKMNRRYIGIEQMDYINTLVIPRLCNVIDGDESGISKAMNWEGGGSFVYCELAELASKYSDRIEQAENSNELTTIWDELKECSNLSYKINPKQFDKNIESFSELSFEDQQRFLIEAIDKNQLYVNYADIDDETNGISELDKKLNKQFYGA